MNENNLWEYNAAMGVSKNPVLSRMLLLSAARKCILLPFSHSVPIPPPPAKDETPVQRHYSCVLSDWRRFEKVSRDDDDVYEFLTQEMADSLEWAVAQAFTSHDVNTSFVPTSSKMGIISTAENICTDTPAPLTKDHLALIRNYLVMNQVPFYDDAGCYIGFFSKDGIHGLEETGVVKTFSEYLKKGDLLYRKETGMCEQVRLVEITKTTALSDSGFVFGRDAIGLIELSLPELLLWEYPDPLRRKQSTSLRYEMIAIAWSGKLAFDVMYKPETGRTRIVRVVRQYGAGGEANG